MRGENLVQEESGMAFQGNTMRWVIRVLALQGLKKCA